MERYIYIHIEREREVEGGRERHGDIEGWEDIEGKEVQSKQQSLHTSKQTCYEIL